MHHTEEVSQSLAVKKRESFKLALAGNPNSGKSSIFNLLTGLNQKIGNFPGVTVDKKLGKLQLSDCPPITLIDFPGTYSLYPNSLDERIVVQTFSNPSDPNFPDAILYIADITKIEQHLLLVTQLRDLGLPIILVLNMADLAEREGLELDILQLSNFLKMPLVKVSSRSGSGVNQLKDLISRVVKESDDHHIRKSFTRFTPEETKLISGVQQFFSDVRTPYQALLIGHHHQWLPFLSNDQKENIAQLVKDLGFESLHHQVKETMKRYDLFTPAIAKALKRPQQKKEFTTTDKLDQVLTHPFWGTIIFFSLMLLVFQAIFAWASFPMDLIDFGFATLGESIKSVLPAGWFTDLITDGIIAGLGGILIFIPQIAILFFLISILEEVGYMARAAYLFDRSMQFFGLNGRSLVALISGGACAIPAVMSTRTITNWKERMITIMVTPLISCSARIPVYTILIGFVVADVTILGIFNLQGLAFMGLYLLGIAMALIAALVFKLVLKSRGSSFLMLELPEYRRPVMRNVWVNVWEKVKTFTVEAGKVILVISIVLWFLASYGPTKAMQLASDTAQKEAAEMGLSETDAEDLLASKKIEASYAGILGKAIEPAIQPLGFDWKIGIALITSFAAREVFVSTMATIYSIGSTDDEASIKQRLASAVNPDTGQKVYTLATSLSLLVFYVFAMQCMSTLAVVKRETKSWKWPLLQFFYMSILAYLASLLVYNLFSNF